MTALIKNVALSMIDAGGGFRLARLLARGRLVALTYHHVLPEPAEPPRQRPPNVVYVDEFARQIAYLARHCHVVSGDELRAHLAGKPLPPHSVLITFDDGYRNNYQHAFPVLKQHGAPAVFFLTSEFIGDRRRRLWFDRLDAAIQAAPADVTAWLRAHAPFGDVTLGDCRRRLKSTPSRVRDDIVAGIERALRTTPGASIPKDRVEPMLWDEVREMAAAGMLIGAHTASHQVLGAVPADEVLSELLTSRHTIETRLKRECWCFSYPNGEAADVRPSDAMLLRASGFECAFTQMPGFVGSDGNRYLLPRLGIPGTADFRVFLTRATGLHPLITRSASKNWRWAQAS